MAIAKICITPSNGEPYQFDISAKNSVGLQGTFPVAWFWEVARPDGQIYVADKEEFHSEFDYVKDYEYTVKLTVMFSDGEIAMTMNKFKTPHN